MNAPEYTPPIVGGQPLPQLLENIANDEDTLENVAHDLADLELTLYDRLLQSVEGNEKALGSNEGTRKHVVEMYFRADAMHQHLSEQQRSYRANLRRLRAHLDAYCYGLRERELAASRYAAEATRYGADVALSATVIAGQDRYANGAAES